MPFTVAATARIFEDPELPNEVTPHSTTISSNAAVASRSENSSPRKQLNPSSVQPSPLGERHINSPPQSKTPTPKAEDDHDIKSIHKRTKSSSPLKLFFANRDKVRNDYTTGKETPSNVAGSPKKTKSSNLAEMLKTKSRGNVKEGLRSSTEAHLIHESNSERYSARSMHVPSPTKEPELSELRAEKQKQPEGDVFMMEQPTCYSYKCDGHEMSFKGKDVFQDSVSRLSFELKTPQRPFLEHKSSHESIFTEHLDDDDDDDVKETVIFEGPRDQVLSSQRTDDLAWPSTLPSKAPSPISPDRPAFKSKRSSRILETIATLNMKVKREECSTPKTVTVPLTPKELDVAMENMLGRYDIPQNVREQIRGLKPEVKAGLMKGERIGSGSCTSPSKRSSFEQRPSQNHDSDRPGTKDCETESKRPRSRSRTRNRILSLSKRVEKRDNTSTKEESMDRPRSKSRPRSVDIARSADGRAMSSTTSLASVTTLDSATMPGDFIHYLREVQKPELVEIGKLHKLRILLRNESVAWTDAFVKKGGMDEIVQLLYRIMKIEWREEHEDSLLHETLLCLKGLSTTKMAMQRLDTLSVTLFPAILRMLFDPERKGPAEYTTRGIIISLLFSHLSATLHGHTSNHTERARQILSFMRDPAVEKDGKSLDFVAQMHISRPFKVWAKEVTNVTKEVFWIFLHNMNVVSILPTVTEDGSTFARKYFPAARAPHPVAPYVGGVEWDATQYLATHLDLLNGIIASLPTQEERNKLREELRQSGWEKVMGQSLRTCKEKFYAGVHESLRAWVAAANADGWPTEDVRSGPPRDVASPTKSQNKKRTDEAPKIDFKVPAADLPRENEVWV